MPIKTNNFMTPKIRFFTDSGGHNVAYAVQGEESSGKPWLVCPAWWVSHLELDWQSDAFQEFFNTLAQHFTVVRFDRPGTGLSDRERRQFDLRSEADTLASLIEHLNIEQCTLLANSCAGPPAIVYSAENPERVAKLVFIGSYANGENLTKPEIQQVMCDLVRASWGLGSRTLSDIFDPNMSKQEVERHSGLQRKSASAEMAAQLLQLSFDMDAREWLSKVTAPALVVHRQKDHAIPFEAGRELASGLLDAHLQLLSGVTHAPWMGELQEVLQPVLEFLVPSDAPQVTASNIENTQQFIRNGDVWALTFAGKTIHIKNARGLNDLHQLLSAPGKELHVNVLAGEGEAAPQEQSIDTLDQQALLAYKNRLAEIDSELADDGPENTVQQQQRLLEERDALLQQLREGVGLAGRKRALNDPTERNRKAVSARIKSSIAKISDSHSELGEHLKNSVTTGTFCCYSPASPQKWNF
ncbi:alpha/beta hydrolase [Porticoccus sp. W117]|uniref:alpha/beta fold hydrolase n=1 Tax=Porticoccus sp. W117 TaxID=3054777 RepID=UPI0025942264|nr:alpha/beta hydrolase [Porticoccus sp. W117]MDM3870994.1 alpha/beta hydrolase [Porticoccus sp. W117]